MQAGNHTTGSLPACLQPSAGWEPVRFFSITATARIYLPINNTSQKIDRCQRSADTYGPTRGQRPAPGNGGTVMSGSFHLCSATRISRE